MWIRTTYLRYDLQCVPLPDQYTGASTIVPGVEPHVRGQKTLKMSTVCFKWTYRSLQLQEKSVCERGHGLFWATMSSLKMSAYPSRLLEFLNHNTATLCSAMHNALD